MGTKHDTRKGNGPDRRGQRVHDVHERGRVPLEEQLDYVGEADADAEDHDYDPGHFLLATEGWLDDVSEKKEGKLINCVAEEHFIEVQQLNYLC